MYSLIKKFLFKKDPEVAHHWVMNKLQSWGNSFILSPLIENQFSLEKPSLHRKIWDLEFKNPIGLAAGFDKDAKYIDDLAKLGFGYVEIGTLTPQPQAGNEKPRLFRLPKDEALINRMGFNNEGVDAAVKRLKNRKSKIIIGGNIGKNKSTPNEKAIEDYEYCFRKLYDYVDYFVINVSSPNTPSLRELQEKEPLKRLLSGLQIINTQMGGGRPILLKIAPDLSNDQLDDIIEIALELNLNGIVATNTTVSRDHLKTNVKISSEVGGLSGKPLKNRSTEVIKYLFEKSNGKMIIIGVGGISTAEDAKEKLNAGASLLQIYTGFVYEGPGIVKKICKDL